MNIPFPSITKGADNKLWISGRNSNFFVSTNNGSTWNSRSTNFTANSLIAQNDNSLIAFNESSQSGSSIIQYRKSTDDGQSWSNPITMTPSGSAPEERPRAAATMDGTL